MNQRCRRESSSDVVSSDDCGAAGSPVSDFVSAESSEEAEEADDEYVRSLHFPLQPLQPQLKMHTQGSTFTPLAHFGHLGFGFTSYFRFLSRWWERI